MKEQFFEDEQFGTVRVRRRAGARTLRLTVSGDGKISLSVPFLCPMKTAMDFFETRRTWTASTLERLSQKAELRLESPENGDILNLSEQEKSVYVEKLREEAKNYLPQRLETLARQAREMTGLDFSYNTVTIKHNRTNWGSCSRKRNINLNLNLMRPTVPGEIKDYVLIHELCHLRYMNHGERFHGLLETLCPGHRGLSRKLARYKLI